MRMMETSALDGSLEALPEPEKRINLVLFATGNAASGTFCHWGGRRRSFEGLAAHAVRVCGCRRSPATPSSPLLYKFRM